MARRGSELVIILWRDIPAQVNGKIGPDKHQAILPRRFQKGIDRAAMVAGKKTAQEYVAEWRRTTHPIVGELAECVDATAASIEREFDEARLEALIANGGWDPARPADEIPDAAADRAATLEPREQDDPQ
jgi:hypothetical protein